MGALDKERRRKDKAYTSLDVARLAGVSQSTVSLVLAGKAVGRVAPSTQETVLQACRDLDYHPNAAARTLRLGRARTVGIVVPNVLNPFFAPVFRGAEQEARPRNYAVVLVNAKHSQSWRQTILETLSAHALDGFVLWGARLKDDLRALENRTVFVEAELVNVPSVQLDVEGGARAAVTHLLDLGHSRIAHLAADLSSNTFRVRHQGYRAALAAAGVSRRQEYEQKAIFTLDDGRAAARRLLALPDPPTAVFCDDDLLAAAVYKAAAEAGLRIPDDVSVVGFDDIDLARMLEPELTTVAVPAERIGRRATALLLDLLDEDPIETTPIRSEFFDLNLVVRGSTAPPRCPTGS